MKTFRQTFHIDAPIEKVWKALVAPEYIESWGGGPCVMNDLEGSEFKLWNGDIHGTNKEVIEEEKLVQAWYAGEWPEPSIVTFALTPKEEGTVIDLLHENIPDKEYDGISKGWDQYYLGAIKDYLERKA